ncbi:trigger factor family protein, partial [Helicobacter japonicus]|uniref:trigger factor family protein n=1 Tax=Helicobacter japonicus TaxID=425400 RepID=UPI00339CDC0C
MAYTKPTFKIFLLEYQIILFLSLRKPMNFTTKRINNANATINGNIALQTLEEKFDKVIKKIAKSVKIDGFRKGKV